jgi:hypothetical protein
MPIDVERDILLMRIATLQSLRTAAERLGDIERIAALNAQIEAAQAALQAAGD